MISNIGAPNRTQLFRIGISLTDLKYSIEFVILFIPVYDNIFWCRFGLNKEN
jgi:hypothetical protein